MKRQSFRKKLEIVSLIFIFLSSLVFPLAQNVTQAAPPSTIYADVDGDGNLEQARNNDANTVNGFETFYDSDGSTSVVKSGNFNWDGHTDFFLDINNDGLPEKYWNPSDGILSDVTITKIESSAKATLDDWVFSSAGNGVNDRYYSPNFKVIRRMARATDLSVTKTVNNPTPNPGDSITYTFTVANTGSEITPGVQVADAKAPSQFIYQSSSAAQGSYDYSSGLWTVGTMTPDATTTLTLTVQVPTDFSSDVMDPTATVSFTPTSTPIDLPKGNLTDTSTDASFVGEHDGDWLGVNDYSVGDINGDGYDDFVASGYSQDSTYGYENVIFGKPTGWQKDVPVTSADNVLNYFDNRVGGALGGFDYLDPIDLNGDGLKDLVFVDVTLPDDNLITYIIFGKKTGWPTGPVDIGNSTDFFDTALTGVEPVSNPGDVNHDGIDDLGLIDLHNFYYVLFGKRSGWAGEQVGTSTEFSFTGATDDLYSPLALGDINGDGIDDFRISDTEGDGGRGETFLFFGRPSGWQQGQPADASIIGEAANNQLPYLIYDNEEPLGDVNGDGINDIGLSTDQNSQNGLLAGKAYLIFGRTSGWQEQMDAGTVADASFLGEGYKNKLIFEGSIGDVNGDGIGDIGLNELHISGSPILDGRIFVILGKKSGWQLDENVASASDASYNGATATDMIREVASVGDFNADGYNDFEIDNNGVDQTTGKVYLMMGKPSGWETGQGVATASAAYWREQDDNEMLTLKNHNSANFGDLNGDGYADMVIGSYENNEGGDQAGKVYVVFGKEDKSWLIDSDYTNNSATVAVQVQSRSLAYSAGTNGSISGDAAQVVAIGANGSAVTATPNPGYRFASWSDGSTANPRTDINVMADISVTASFEIIPVSGGGTPSLPSCSSVVYGDWGSCVNGFQYRNILSQSPANCPLTSAQQAARSMVCGTIPSNLVSVPTSPLTPVAPALPSAGILQIISSEAGIVSSANVQNLLADLNVPADPAGEQASQKKYQAIFNLDQTLPAADKTVVNDFIVYGTPSTLRLGSGERAGVINSYFQAYGKLPDSEAEWSDVIKISNGRWPSARSAAAENQAKLEFKKVYGRSPALADTYDQNAVMVIAYGLIPTQRNLASEISATKTFRLNYGHAPANALAWNIVRAIAYSGAKR